MIEAAVLGAFFFGILGFVGIQLGNAVVERLERLPDSPEPFNTPVPLLLGGCAIIGALTVPLRVTFPSWAATFTGASLVVGSAATFF